MPNAAITTVNYAGNGTQAGLLNAISAAMVTAGFTEIKTYNNAGNEARVWSYVADASKTYGTLIIEAAFIDASTLRIRGYSNFDVASVTPATAGLNPSEENKSLTSLSSNFVFWVCNHPEVRGLILVEGVTNYAFIGYFRPATFEDWDENSFPKAFIGNGFLASWDTSALQCISSLIPTGTTSTTLKLQASENARSHPRSGRRKLSVAGISAVAGGQRFIEAEFSSDVTAAASSGMQILDKLQVQVGIEEYMLFDGSTSTSAPRLAVRVI